MPAKAGIQAAFGRLKRTRHEAQGAENETTLCLHSGEQAKRHVVYWGHLLPRAARLAAQNDVVEGFTKRYRVHILVWFEIHHTVVSAIAREKAIKEWKRAWKTQLIEKSNPTWRDLYGEIV
jgi:putative endonuclease